MRYPILSDGTDATPERVATILGGVRRYPETVHPTVAAQLVETVQTYRGERSFLLALVGREIGAQVITADVVNRGLASGAEVDAVMAAAREMLR